MQEVKRGEILADKIADVLTTTPLAFDPEDNDDVTKPSDIADTNADEYGDVGEHNILSQFRKSNIDLLADVDERYAGKKTRRKELDTSDDDDDLKGANIGLDDVESEDFADTNDESEHDSPQDYSDEEEFLDNGADDGQNNHHRLFKNPDTNTQLQKGECVRNQMSLWENFLEIRIQLQKCLVAANKMPSHEHFKDIKQKSGAELSAKVDETKKNVATLLDKMLLLQDTLLKRYPETKNIFKNSADKPKVDDGDEEIPSDTEEENTNESSDDECIPTKKRKTHYNETLGEKFTRYKPYVESVIQKWNDKTRLASSNKNTSNAYSVTKQIEYALSNKEKLLKKTQLKKSNYEIIGEHSPEGDFSEKHHPEIFDDDDFYHQLLRDLIECKSSDITDPVQLGRQWIQLQSMRSKMKKNVDTRATKGRKIRYAVHSKLVNFMAPIDEGDVWNEDAKKELYGSLFGNFYKKGTTQSN